MSLTKTISILAQELEEQFVNAKQNHIEMLSVMKRMPEYLEKNDLAAWEQDYRSSIGAKEDEQSLEYKVIDMLYELAGLNLFGAYDFDRTKEVYQWLVNELSKLNFRISKNLNVSSW